MRPTRPNYQPREPHKVTADSPQPHHVTRYESPCVGSIACLHPSAAANAKKKRDDSFQSRHTRIIAFSPLAPSVHAGSVSPRREPRAPASRVHPRSVRPRGLVHQASRRDPDAIFAVIAMSLLCPAQYAVRPFTTRTPYCVPDSVLSIDAMANGPCFGILVSRLMSFPATNLLDPA